MKESFRLPHGQPMHSPTVKRARRSRSTNIVTHLFLHGPRAACLSITSLSGARGRLEPAQPFLEGWQRAGEVHAHESRGTELAAIAQSQSGFLEMQGRIACDRESPAVDPGEVRGLDRRRPQPRNLPHGGGNQITVASQHADKFGMPVVAAAIGRLAGGIAVGADLIYWGHYWGHISIIDNSF